MKKTTIFLMLALLLSAYGLALAEPKGGDTRVREIDGMTMAYVPAGEFEMGSADDNVEDETPIRNVFLDGFWIDQTEVTNEQYAKCVGAGACEEPYPTKSDTRDDYYGNAEFAGYPVIHVDWDQAKDYCAWAGGDLPTEAQWEKAARGTDARMYPWGNEFDGSKLNYCDKNCDRAVSDKSVDDGHADTAPVCNYPSGNSPYGVCDMAGNVLEWVNDWYDDTYYQKSDTNNPLGPASGNKRVQRGGSMGNNIPGTVSLRRFRDEPRYGSSDVGFRCVFASQ